MGDRCKPSRNRLITRKRLKSISSQSDLEEIAEANMGKPKSESSSCVMKEMKERKKCTKKERWLLTRKTWRYMADAGRKLIPDGSHNRQEDVPKIEAYFQEVCHREPRFLLWRKQSYPGAIGLRSQRRSRGFRRKQGGSCRERTSSADEADDVKTEYTILPTTSGRFDIQRLKAEFLLGKSDIHKDSSEKERVDGHQFLLNTLESYLNVTDEEAKTRTTVLDHVTLLEKLRDHLAEIESVARKERRKTTGVHFEGDHSQKMLLETLRRYYNKSVNRDKVISDLLTDRKQLEKLYFDLRRVRGFTAGRRGTGVATPSWSIPYRRDHADLDEEVSGDEERNEEVRSPPLMEVKEVTYGTQTDHISDKDMAAIENAVKRINIAKNEAEEAELKGQKSPTQRRSSVDNDDVSPSVSDTIKRYLRMARKKSVDSDKADRFKRVNYDRNLRNIKAKGEITQIGDDDGLDKGAQTEETWIEALKEVRLEPISEVVRFERSLSFDPRRLNSSPTSPTESRLTSSRSSIDSPPLSPPSKSPTGILSSGQSFLSSLLHGLHANPASVSTAGAMQKSKSSSSVVQQGSRLVAKKIWKSRSKSSSRATPAATSAWTPQGRCVWSNVTGRRLTLSDTSLLQLSDLERRILQKVALAKLQALNLGVVVRIPNTDIVSSSGVQKPKRRAYLLKRKAITTGFFDTNKEDKDKDGNRGHVFGISLSECIESERLSKSRSESSSGQEEALRRKSHHGSRSSFSSLIEPRLEESGSCDGVISPTLSMPGLLDSLSCGSTQDLTHVGEGGLPNIVSSCLTHLENYGLHTLGIFRVSSSKKRVRQLREEFDCGKIMNLDDEMCPHDVATLLKEYLRDLPDSLLCKDLYQVFILTQRIRNRRLQQEAVQHLIQMLPVANRDTLWALLNLLALVAHNSSDKKDTTGEWVVGNKMDSSNLATLFAPNILRNDAKLNSNKDELSAERTEERSDAINVVRHLIDNYKSLFMVSAELLDEVYVHMMDSNPEALDQHLRRPHLACEVTDVDAIESQLSEEGARGNFSSERLASVDSSASASESSDRRVWSREAFTHQTAGMGGPDISMRPRRERDRVREGRDQLSKKGVRRRGEGEGSNTPSRRTSTNSCFEQDQYLDYEGRGEMETGVITASLKIPVPTTASFTLNLDDADIPYIEDTDRHSTPLNMNRTCQRVRSTSGSDSSQATQRTVAAAGYDSAFGSSAAHSGSQRANTPPQSVSSYSSGGVYSSPVSSTPPTSPDSNVTSVDYLEEPTTRNSYPTKRQPATLHRVTVKSGLVQQVQTGYNQPETRIGTKDASSAHQHLLTSGSDKIVKSDSLTAIPVKWTTPICDPPPALPDRKVTPSISSIGGAVLRSKTADIERILQLQAVPVHKSNPLNEKEDEKKYKRRYTDLKRQARHVPSVVQSEARVASSSRTGIWKRREIISSEPKERKSYL